MRLRLRKVRREGAEGEGLRVEHRVGVGFLEGRELLLFYTDFGREAAFTILC